MKTPPHRIAAIALVVLLLAGAGAWWWRVRAGSTAALPAAVPVAARPGAAASAPPSSMTASRARGTSKADPATEEAVERCGHGLLEVVGERARKLASRNDATSQLAYALSPDLNQGEVESEQDYERAMAAHNERITRAFARAMALDPGNPDIPWLASSRCDPTSAKCRSMQQALLAAEPDNAAAWLREAAWAHMRGDEPAQEAAFKRAAAATRYDTHVGAAALPLVEAYRGMPTPAACTDPVVQEAIRKQMPGGRAFDPGTVVELLGMAGDQMGASALYMGLDGMCKAQDGGALAPDRRADCIRVYTAVAGGNTMLEQLTATARLVELVQDGEGAAEWRERFRQQRWMLEQQRVLGAEFDVFAEMDGAAALQEALRKQGLWPPPADWLPSDERARSLILTGRPPEPRRK